MHRDAPAFSKWDLQKEESRPPKDPAGAPTPPEPSDPTDPTRPEEKPSRPGSDPGQPADAEATRRRVHKKMWMLRTAWLVSTGMLVFGALLMILVLSGHGHLLGI